MFQDIGMFKNKVATLHLNEINIQTTSSCVNKSSIVGQSFNDAKTLADWMLVFLLSTLHGKRTKLNFCSKLVINMNSDYQKRVLMEYLEKSNETNFEIVAIISDRTWTNCKMMRELLELTSSSILNNPSQMSKSEMIFSPSFTYQNKKIFLHILNHSCHQMH